MRLDLELSVLGRLSLLRGDSTRPAWGPGMVRHILRSSSFFVMARPRVWAPPFGARAWAGGIGGGGGGPAFCPMRSWCFWHFCCSYFISANRRRRCARGRARPPRSELKKGICG